MAHYVLFFGSTTKRHTTACTFPSRKAAEKHAKDWSRDGSTDYAVGKVVNIKRFKDPKRRGASK